MISISDILLFGIYAIQTDTLEWLRIIGILILVAIWGIGIGIQVAIYSR